MWEFRRRPGGTLTPEEKQNLEKAVREVAAAADVVRTAAAVPEESSTRRRIAARPIGRLLGLFLDMLDHFPELAAFIRTFEAWQEEILNYFDARQTSGPVEGINNKARVIVKRAFGLKSPESLWTRLILDLNRASDVILYTIEQMQGLVAEFRAVFSPSCT